MDADRTSERRQCAGKRTLTRQSLNVGSVPGADIQTFQFSGMQFLIVIRYSALSASSGLPWNATARTVMSSASTDSQPTALQVSLSVLREGRPPSSGDG